MHDPVDDPLGVNFRGPWSNGCDGVSLGVDRDPSIVIYDATALINV